MPETPPRAGFPRASSCSETNCASGVFRAKRVAEPVVRDVTMEKTMGNTATTGEVDVPQLAGALVRYYRQEVIPDAVSEFESWGFEKEALREKDDEFFCFVALASYDRQPFTFKGGSEAVWSEDPGSVRRLLESKRLLKHARVLALS